MKKKNKVIHFSNTMFGCERNIKEKWKTEKYKIREIDKK